MAGLACKAIINNGVRALAESLEQILTHPLVRDVKITAAECDALIQVMADVDLAAYDPRPAIAPVLAGKMAGLSHVMLHLEKAGVLTPEVWAIYRHPGNPWTPPGS